MLVAEALANEIASLVAMAGKQGLPFSMALSGGSTPDLLFEALVTGYSGTPGWERVSFFWVDERCVPPDDPESNFGSAKRLLLRHINVPEANIHRIWGEADPASEISRYAGVLTGNLPVRNNWPEFDLILLGIGEDGHTGSIFPGNLGLFEADKLCEMTVHPGTGQKRITITGKVINNAKRLIFLATGHKKAHILEAIHKKTTESLNFPAAFVKPENGELIWYVDGEAGKFIR